MFLKRLKRRKNGKGHTYWALVESYRAGKGSRHRVVAYLGEIKKSERNGRAQLGRRLDVALRPHVSLFDSPHYDDPAADEPVLAKLKNIHLDRLRDLGDVWLPLGLWRLLKLDVSLAELMPAGEEDVPWPLVAAILTIARFCDRTRQVARGAAPPPEADHASTITHRETCRTNVVTTLTAKGLSRHR